MNESTIAFVKYLDTGDVDAFEEDFKMFPNPVSGNVLNIQLADKNDGSVTYRIVSMLGRVVANGQLINDNIKVDHLNSGIYVLEINDGEELMTRKFVKK